MKDEASKDYFTGYELQVAKIQPIINIGIENLTIKRIDTEKSTDESYDCGHNVHLKFAVNCWVKGVRSQNTSRHHIAISRSSHIEVSGCHLQYANDYGGDSYGYGVLLGESSTNCLIENSIFRVLRHSMGIGTGANCNVFASNYSREVNATWWVFTYAAPDICIHGRYSYANLFEHNYVENIVADDEHGDHGPHNAFVRNITSDGDITLLNAPNTALLGCELSDGDPIHTEGGEETTFSVDEYAFYSPYNNWLDHTWASGSGLDRSEFILGDVSYNYSTTPDFLGTVPFPSIGPKAEGYPAPTNDIPARIRYNSGGFAYINDPMQLPPFPVYTPYTKTTGSALFNKIADNAKVTFINSPLEGLANNSAWFCEIWEISASANFNPVYSEIPTAWLNQIGYSNGNPNNASHYLFESTTPTSTTLKTYFYKIKCNASSGEVINKWAPYDPNVLAKQYEVIGIPKGNMTSSGTLTQNETWYGTHTLTGNVVVPAGITLTVGSGAIIKVNSGFQLIIHGKISVDNATFQSNGSGNWYGLIIDGAVKSYVTNCRFKECNYGVVVGGATNPGSNPEIRKCDIQAGYVGIWIKQYGNPWVTNCHIKSTGLAAVRSTNNAKGNFTNCRMYGTSTYGYTNENSASTDFAYCASAKNLYETGFAGSIIYVSGGYPVYNGGRNCINLKSGLTQYSNQTGSSRDSKYNYWGGGAPIVAGSTVNFTPYETVKPVAGPDWVLAKTSGDLAFEDPVDKAMFDAWQAYHEGDYGSSKALAKDLFNNTRGLERSGEALFIWMKSALEQGTLQEESAVLAAAQKDGKQHPSARFEAVRWLLKTAVHKGDLKKAEGLALSVPVSSAFGRELLLDLAVEILEQWGDIEKADQVFSKLIGRYPDEATKLEKETVREMYRDYLNRVPVDLAKRAFWEGDDAGEAENFLGAGPNPFNPDTKISYRIIQTVRVRIMVYDILGRLVQTLVDEEKDAGDYEVTWPSMSNTGRAPASGVYLCRMQAGVEWKTVKLMILK